ncbi:metabotropic glutamate receptor 4-like [Asterias rubens]|uniref:metabotropic glutamate receptor 4-like n=1 Tax=Asterias rubens TaxID=7604 RepID=UPI0014557211|nr:metabotropic glutamate receptor 4-like [Asterias rubens]
MAANGRRFTPAVTLIVAVIVVAAPTVKATVNQFSLPTHCHVYRQPGDLILGGMFTIARRSPSSCNFTDEEISLGMLLPEAMAFAIQSVNARDDLLPNITLGFEIWDSGWVEDIAVGVALSFVSDSPLGVSQACERGVNRSKVVGIVGPESSAKTVLVSKITQPYQLPIVSHWATSNELSNKARFPFALRTVPPDQFQAGAIVDLLTHFSWEYVAVIYTVDSYGIHGARELISQAEERGVCIALSAPLSELDTERDRQEIVLALKRLSFVRVVIIFAAGALPYSFLQQVSKTDFPYKITWIGSDGWGYELPHYGLEDLVSGGIFTRLNNPKLPAFEEYLNSVDPRLVNAAGPWFTRYWRRYLDHNCTDHAPLGTCTSQLSKGYSATYNIAGPIDAVHVFAHGLHSLLTETCSSGSVKNCSSMLDQVDGKELLKHLLRVNFTGATGPFNLNEDGDPEGMYLFTHLKQSHGQYDFVNIGKWDSRKGNDRLQLGIDLIQWSGVENLDSKPPISSCRQTCSAGYILVPLEQKCCWGCQPCSDNAIILNGTECVSCNLTFWPNDNYETCIPIQPQTIDLADPLITSILAMAGVGFLLSCLTGSGMVYYRHSRLVKATSRELSILNLLGLGLAFLVVIPLLQPPSTVACSASEALISLCFTLTYAPTLLKVNRIYRIFSAGKRSVRPPRFVSPGHQLAMAAALILVQVVAVVFAGLLQPAVPALLFTSPPSDHIELYCVFSPAFPGFCAYNLLIVLLCCYFALLARKVPDNYNESKFIGVSVYSSLVLGIAVVPVYTTASRASQKVSFLAIAVVANSFITIFFVYFPKLFAIRFQARVHNQDGEPRTLASTLGAGNAR